MDNFAERIKMHVDRTILGKIIAENIHNALGALVIGVGSTLDKRIINKLQQLGYEEIWVYKDKEDENRDDDSLVLEDELSQDIEMNNDEPHKIYAIIKNSIESMMESIEDDKQISYKKIYSISDMLIHKFNDHGDLLQMINYFKSMDKTTYSHSIVVGLLCLMMGRWMDFKETKIRDLVCAGLLHHIKESKMTDKYLSTMDDGTSEKLRDPNEYAEFVYESMQKNFGMNLDITLGVLQHQEREDGSGYPMGLKGEQTHEFAKIIAIVDTYDNLMSQYVYENEQSAFKVLEIFFNNSFGLFSPKYLHVFLNNISYFHLGDIVTLNTGKQAEVIFINTNYISRPIVKMDDVYIDLFENKELEIM